MDCNGLCAECKDAECKAIEFKSFHKISWTRELKFALKKLFDDIEKGEFEDDDDDI